MSCRGWSADAGRAHAPRRAGGAAARRQSLALPPGHGPRRHRDRGDPPPVPRIRPAASRARRRAARRRRRRDVSPGAGGSQRPAPARRRRRAARRPRLRAARDEGPPGRRRGRAGRGPRAPAGQRRAPCAARSGRARAGAGALLRCAAGRGARNPLRAPPRGMKVSVLAFDLSDNATGRADLLARLLAPRYEVEVVGPRFGTDIWRPARDGAVRYRSEPGARWPRLARKLPALARLADGDVLLASKPRPTSFGVGLLARRQRHRPLILDVDDWELGFFYRASVWSRVGRLLNLANPNSLPWTWLAERLVARA